MLQVARYKHGVLLHLHYKTFWALSDRLMFIAIVWHM